MGTGKAEDYYTFDFYIFQVNTDFRITFCTKVNACRFVVKRVAPAGALEEEGGAALGSDRKPEFASMPGKDIPT